MNKRDEIYLETRAQEFRNRNGLGATEPIRLKSVLQKLNVLVLYRPLSTDCSGMSIKIETKDMAKRYMLVNSTHSIARQHFTICHELYHLFVQENFTVSKSSAGKFDAKGDQDEYKADIFASYLLLPRLGVLEMIPPEEQGKNSISLSTIIGIEQFYACSHMAMLIRLKQLGFIDQNLLEQYKSIGIKRQAHQLGYSTKIYEPGNENEIIGDYGVLAYNAWDQGIISESMYLSLLSDIGIDLSKLAEDNDTREDL